MRFGFIGLGKMGGGLCATLLRNGCDVTVCDINPEVIKKFIALGAKATTSPKELAAGLDACISCLPMPKDAAAVLLGPDGIFENLPKGAAHFDLSTLDIPSVVRFEEEAKRVGVSYLVIPMGKGPAAAAAGETPLFGGGDKAVYDKFEEPLLKKMGKPAYMGDVKAAEAFKLITNLMGMSNNAIISEGIKLAKRMGISKEAFLSQVPNTGGFSYQFMNTASGTFDEDFLNPIFTVNLAYKDVRLGVEMAEDLNQPVPMMSTARNVFKAAAEKHGEENFTATFKML